MNVDTNDSWRIPRKSSKSVESPPKLSEKKELSLQELSSKVLLTLEEANRYTGLGLQKLRDITNSPNCQMVLWNGSKRMMKLSISVDTFISRIPVG